ncbi:hypothetical protein AFLA70_271g001040 [Aspergillus flavus AF70]|nr:hypothetical protein AFLA70_271g001040 [Aspergillus flavus AF70]
MKLLRDALNPIWRTLRVLSGPGPNSEQRTLEPSTNLPNEDAARIKGLYMGFNQNASGNGCPRRIPLLRQMRARVIGSIRIPILSLRPCKNLKIFTTKIYILCGLSRFSLPCNSY